ncbi:DUF4349 domain-containing protein [Pseudonocardia sp.]|uniref:DUF4349 domain-containing protein n=1 Tax=Pseudonocardia sp. TaxID=60912 RepID=UPI002601FD36|nr:DUF4349 domain-containing protein [Pseudonocardia sp.]
MTVARWTSRRWVVGAGVVLVVVAGLAVALAGVGGGGPDGSASSSVGEIATPARPGTEVSADAAVGESAAAPDEPASAAQPGVPVGTVTRSLVRTAQITVEVTDPEIGVRDLRASAAAAGGFVAEEQSGRNGGWVVLRVPAEALDRLVEQVGALGTVTERSAHVVDATEEVVDLDARVASQQASVARVRALLAEATSIGDIVAVESELARREAELDSLTGRLTALRDQVQFSTLTVDLRTPDGGPVDDEPSPAGFLDGLGAGWNGLVALGSGTGAVLGFLLPFLPVLAVLGGIGWLVRRAVRARRATPSPAGGPTG